jgi:transposase
VVSRHVFPNPENASLSDLQAARRAGNRETDRRCLVIIMLLVGSSREQVRKTVELSDSAVRKIVTAFNHYGVDGLIAKKRPGRKRLFSEARAEEILEEFEDPGRAQRTFWTATAFYGHVAGKYRVECSYETVRRLLHEKGYVLKVPQPWPDRQDEERRDAFRKTLCELAEDPEVELWYGDETGVDGEPKPRRSSRDEGLAPEGGPQWRSYPPQHHRDRMSPLG